MNTPTAKAGFIEWSPQGISEADVAFFRENGFLVIENAIDADEVSDSMTTRWRSVGANTASTPAGSARTMARPTMTCSSSTFAFIIRTSFRRRCTSTSPARR